MILIHIGNQNNGILVKSRKKSYFDYLPKGLENYQNFDKICMKLFPNFTSRYLIAHLHLSLGEHECVW